MRKSRPADVLPVIRSSGEDFTRLCSDDAAVYVKTGNLKWKGIFAKVSKHILTTVAKSRIKCQEGHVINKYMGKIFTMEISQ